MPFMTLGDKLKQIEAEYTNISLYKTKPVYARLDGRSFHSFTRPFARPYDKTLSKIMIETAEQMVKEFNVNLSYTQSDEISLVWLPKENTNSEFVFNGKIQKLVSCLSSYCSSTFLKLCFDNNITITKVPTFDCRVLNIDDYKEMLKWRAIDAKKNAISMVAHYYIGHKKTQNINSNEKIAILKNEYNVDFYQYPDFFKFGTYLYPKTIERMLTKEELMTIPKNHRPDGPVKRTTIIKTSEYPL